MKRSATRPVLITDAEKSQDQQLHSREIRYAVMMGIRVVCILVAFFIPGWPKWLVIAGAVILPGVAVLLANQPNQKKLVAAEHHDAGTDTAGAVTDGSYEIVPGEVVDDETHARSASEHSAA